MKLAIVPAVWDSHPTWLPHGWSPVHATRLWAVWQGLIPSFAHCFTRPGWRRFVTVPAARWLARSSDAPSLWLNRRLSTFWMMTHAIGWLLFNSRPLPLDLVVSSIGP